MLRRNRRGDVGRRVLNERNAFGGRNVLEHDTQLRKIADDLRQMPVNKNPLAIEDIDVRIGHFAVQR